MDDKRQTLRVTHIREFNENDPRYEITVIRWDRLFLAAVLLIGALTLLLWTLWPADQPADHTPTLEVTSAGEAAIEPPEREANASTPATTSAGTTPATEADNPHSDPVSATSGMTPAEVPSSTPAQLATVMAPADPAPSATITEHTPAVTEQAPATTEPQSLAVVAVVSEEAQTTGRMPVTSAVAAPAATTPKSASPATAPGLAPTSPRATSRFVKSLQLTSDLHQSRPIDQLGKLIPMNEQGLIKVFLYSELTGLKGKRIAHEWYLDGKRVARVNKGRLSSDPAPVYSSKYIDRFMKGHWEARVVSENTKVLASLSFEVY